MMFFTKILWCIVNICESHTALFAVLVQSGVDALGQAAFHGQLAMVEFLLGRGFDLLAKDIVRLHLSYIAFFFLFSPPIIGAINACSLLQRYESAEVSKTSVVMRCE
jgi:hypothetical protein